MLYPRALAFAALLLSVVSAAPQNETVDDHEYSRINYVNAGDWQHDPLQGNEGLFYLGTRSFSYVPGAYASFSFTGTGIYLQGPWANDQANRRVTLDGKDMGVFSTYSPNWQQASVFWGVGNLANGYHTVTVTHVDTTTKLLVMDAWIVESDPNTPGPTTVSPADPSSPGFTASSFTGVTAPGAAAGPGASTNEASPLVERPDIRIAIVLGFILFVVS